MYKGALLQKCSQSKCETPRDNGIVPHDTPTPDDAARCPCLSGNSYGDCCAPIHRGAGLAPTAERLMRSRFSAFALGLPEYLLDSWHPSTRPEELELDPHLRWQLLDILRTERGGPFDRSGIVEFRATFRDGTGTVTGTGGSTRGELHETSSFVREGQRWYYVDGVTD